MALLLSASLADASSGADLPIEEFELANGMRFLLLRRPSMPTVEAGWVVNAGSAYDPASSTGVSHFIEHMMFKGSRTIGASDIEQELALLERLADIDEALGTLSANGRRAERQRAELEREQGRLESEAQALSQLGAFSLEYSRAGATRLNANTAADLTLFYVTVPAEALELWFWLESDRLREPVFREFSKEKRVVAEERRQRIESTPTGAADLELEATFWRGSSYAQPPLGLPQDLADLRRRELSDFFTLHYRPTALTAVLVGDFDVARVRDLARSYFGRLDAGPARQPGPAQAALDRSREETLDQTCVCPPQVRVRYPTVPFGHSDQFALQALAGLLSGRTGRLYRNLVLGREIAFAAFAQQTPLRRAGSFTVTLEAKGGARPDALLRSWDEELERLMAEPPTAAELSGVKRRLATEHLSQLKDPHLLMRRLLVYAGLGDWRQLADWTQRINAVEAGQVQAVARRYLAPERRLVGIYRRQGAEK